MVRPGQKRKGKKRKTQKLGRNARREHDAIVRVDKLVEAVLRNNDNHDNTLSLPAADDKSMGAMRHRHKLEVKALRSHVLELKETRLRLAKTLENMEERKAITERIKRIQESQVARHEAEVAAFEQRSRAGASSSSSSSSSSFSSDNCVDDDHHDHDSVDVQQRFYKKDKKTGPLRILSNVHTPGPRQ
jgi:hypothetical protein